MKHILIIDDNPTLCNLMRITIERMGHAVSCALELNQGMEVVASGKVDVVFLDVNLPDGNGLSALPKIRATPSSPEVVIITGQGDPDGAELAIKSGAWDYLQKPFSSIQELSLTVSRVLQYRQEKLSSMHRKALERDEIIGTSQIMGHCLDLAHKAAHCDAGVLITGETGTGKELFARMIHRNSARKEGNFVVVDCASLPETLVESTLFGHVKGAFTGAVSDRKGLIEQANHGTLFLDEVGDLPPTVQKAFLRVLQERCFRPVGAGAEVESDFRLIAATHRDLDAMIGRGLFRKDLLYRMKSIHIHLPPLRNRKGDIFEIALQTLTGLCRRYRMGARGFSPQFVEAVSSYEWPGNVRELVNCIESALSEAGEEPVLIPRHLPTRIRIQLARDAVAQVAPKEAALQEEVPTGSVLCSFRDFMNAVILESEKDYLQRLLHLTGRDIKESCRVADLSRARLYTLLKKHGFNSSKRDP
jgi:two-component system NtrC family response regulator